MPRRIDYLDDPNAPEPNSLKPSANVVVVNQAGQILLIKRTDNSNWSLPGGAMDLGETIGQTAVRETREETGIECELTGLVGIYTNPNHVLEYTSDGEVRQEFSMVFTARVISGSPTPSTESSQVVWVSPDATEEYEMHPSMRQRVSHFIEGREQPYIG
jgi:8-oxo-dGTP pyrophosphatase MutT (NUDIX family)